MQTRNPRRGATLLVTVLLGLVAASITLVIVKTSLDNARSNAARRAYDVAYAAARSTADDTARRLAADPYVMLREVGPDEPGRICEAVLVDGEPIVVAPGQAWPADCGARWTYDESESSTNVWLRPPTGADPALLIRAVVEVAGTRAGVELRMLPGRNGALTLSSEGALNLSQLRRGTGNLTVSGLVHAGGVLDLPSSDVTWENDSVLASESGFTGTVPTGVRRYGAQPSTDEPVIGDVRTQVPSQLVAGTLRARHLELLEAACPGGTMRNVADGSTELCLAAGGQLVDAGGSSVSAPPTMSAWLLLPGRSGSGTIDVLYRISDGDEALVCPTAQPTCSLPQLAASTPGHPALLSAWTSLGTFRLPAGALVSTDRTTHLGLCGPAGVGQASTCTVHGSGSSPGVTSEGFTLLVGSATDAADLYVSGPVRQGSGRIGVLVSGDVLLPYWSHPVGGDLDVEIDLAVLGRTADAPVRSLPSPRPSNQENVGDELRLNGAIALARGPLDLDGFESVSTTLKRPSAPWWAASAGWRSESVRRLDASELAVPGNFD